MRRLARVDANHQAVVTGLRELGVAVLDLSAVGRGCPDVLCDFAGVLTLLEIKNKAARGKLTERQERWRLKWRGRPPAVVWSLEDAMTVLGIRREQ